MLNDEDVPQSPTGITANIDGRIYELDGTLRYEGIQRHPDPRTGEPADLACWSVELPEIPALPSDPRGKTQFTMHVDVIPEKATLYFRGISPRRIG